MKGKTKIYLFIIILSLVFAGFGYKGYQYWLASISDSIGEEIILNKENIPPKKAVAEEGEIMPEGEADNQAKTADSPQDYPAGNIEKEKQVVDNNIYLSADKLEQGDTLLVRIRGEKTKGKVEGKFGLKKVDFFKLTGSDDWFAIIGIDAKEKPGEYNLEISFSDGKFQKEVEIVKRAFPITVLYVSPELEDKGYTPSKIAGNIATKDNPSIYDVLDIYTPESYFNQSFVYPLKNIKNVGAFGNIRKNGDVSLQHLGVDLDAEIGTPVHAINKGKVCFTEELINYGNTLIVDHGLGIYSLYLHLSEFKAVKGEFVKRGEIIGLSGNTGYSIAPHLHFSIKANGASVDPLKFIEATGEEKIKLN